jgi:hypothetical protein
MYARGSALAAVCNPRNIMKPATIVFVQGILHLLKMGRVSVTVLADAAAAKRERGIVLCLSICVVRKPS